MLALTDFQDQDIEDVLKRPAFCQQKHHEKEELKFFCKDYEVAICNYCVAILHEGHTKTHLEEAANERKLQVKSAIELHKQKAQQKRNKIAELDRNCVHIEEQAAAVKRNVHYVENFNPPWTCSFCSLPKLNDSFFEQLSDGPGPSRIISQEAYGGDARDLYIGPSDDHAEPSVVDDSLREFAMGLRQSSVKDFKVAHLNVRSLRSKIDEIRLLQELCNFDILAITESHLDSSVPDFHIEIEGLRFFRLDRPKRKGGGCVLYYAENLTVIYRRDLSDKNLEAIWIQVNLPSVIALFSVIYKAPDDNDFFDRFQKQLESAWLRSSYIFLLGDLNCDLNILNTASRNRNAAKLLCIFDALNLENTITSPTRFTPSCESLIDLIVTSKKELIHSSGVFHLGISDHSLIYASIRLTGKRPPAKIIKTRNYKNFDESNFQQDISFAPFHVASVFDDPDDKLWAWNKLFLDVCDEHAPLTDVKVRSSSLPWITNSIRLKINLRYKLFKLAVNTKCPHNWSE